MTDVASKIDVKAVLSGSSPQADHSEGMIEGGVRKAFVKNVDGEKA